MRNSQTPLTPHKEDSFEHLREIVDGMDNGCPRATTTEVVGYLSICAPRLRRVRGKVLSVEKCLFD